MSARLRVRLLRPFFPKTAFTAEDVGIWVGRQSQVYRVVRGLLASTEAHYLITGYPGVGKTSFAKQVVNEWRKLSTIQGNSRILVFNLRFGWLQSTTEVVQRIIGKVYFSSIDGQFSPDRELVKRLHLSFIRTHSKYLREKKEETTSKEKGAEANIISPTMESLLGIKAGLSSKGHKQSSWSLEIQREYNLSAALEDLESILYLLTRPESWWRRKILPFRKLTGARPRVLFVFDGIDSLSRIQDLKNLFSLPNAAFIVIGGMNLRHEIERHFEQGDYVLNDFREEYLPCLWDAADQILPLLLSKEDMGARRFADFRDYLNFYAQGLPRRLLFAIESHVRFEGETFWLEFTDSDLAKIRLGAKLHRVLHRNRFKILGEHVDSLQYHIRDRALRGVYHLTDQIFRVTRFSFDAASTVATQLSDNIAIPTREQMLANMLKVFVSEGLIKRTGDTYELSESILKLVRQISDWLKNDWVTVQSISLSDTTIGDIPESPTSLEGFLTVAGRAPVNSPGTYDQQPTDIFILEEKKNRYKIVQLVGRGGTGQVYLAVDTVLNRQVALKVLNPTLSSDVHMYERFMQEARILARLSHPNIVYIYDVWKTNRYVVLVTEYVDGGSLLNLLRGQDSSPLPLTRALQIAIAVAHALEAAHAQGIVHRDVKPSNILIASNGNVKLTDFGIAKILWGDSTRTIDTVNRLVGTPQYMAPEQIIGGKIDGRTDIYALGAVLYEMITGKHYLHTTQASTDSSRTVGVFWQVMNERPSPPSHFAESIPEELDHIVMTCLAKRPRERFSKVEELIEQLEHVLETVPNQENDKVE